MLKPGDRHLTEDELDLLAGNSLLLGPAGVRADSSDRAHSGHLDECNDCRSGLEQRIAAVRSLASLRVSSSETRGEHCPSDEEWMNVAAGLTDENVSRELIDHATSCDHCGPLFRQFVQQFSDNLSSDETEIVARLASSSRDWQNRLASRLSASSLPQEEGTRSPARLKSRKWRAFGLAAAVAAAVLIWVFYPRPEQRVEKLLAQAYTERRTLELRIPAAQHAPLQIQREAGQPHLSKPAPLLEAEAFIIRKLVKQPNDPALLEAEGRAEVLDWEYDLAITTLKAAQQTHPESFSLKVDLASAYFERATAGQSSDFGRAVELLSQVLATRPNDPIALFNRALVYERMFLYREAITDWNQYLKIDPTGDWAEEARQHLQDLQKKVTHHEKDRAPLLPLPEFVRTMSVDDERTWSHVDDRIEDYLESAVLKWLPLAYDDGKESKTAVNALSLLARILSIKHHDEWLPEILAIPQTHETKNAFVALAKSLEANNAGNPAVGRAYAHRAQTLFSRASNRPGFLRAQTEELYALHRLFLGPECLRLTIPLKKSLSSSSYNWIATQVALEEYACWTSQARLGKGQALVATALKLAKDSGYPVLYLRAIGFLAGLHTDEGNVTEAWSRDLQGLQKYWDGPYPPLRAYQFYADMGITAETQQRPHLLLALQREAVREISLSANRSGEAMARFRLATVASQVASFDEASTNYQQAAQLFAELPKDPGTRTFLADSQIGLAEVETRRGSLTEAERQLEGVRPNVVNLQAYATRLEFYRALYEVRTRRADFDGAEESCRAVIAIAEIGLGSIHTDQERRTWTSATSDCYRFVVSARLRRHNEKGALELWESYQGAPLRSESNQHQIPLDNVASPPTDSDLTSSRLVDRALPTLEKETMVTFAELPDGPTAWVYDNRGLATYRLLGTVTQIEAAAERFASACAEPMSDTQSLRDDAQLLYSWLIAPLVAGLDPTRTIVIEADRAMARIPFEALVDPHGRYLTDTYPLAYSMGLAFFQRLKPTHTLTTHAEALVVGNPSISTFHDRRLVSLGEAVDEARFVGSKFQRALILTGNDATVAVVLGKLPRAVVFHFAGHALNSVEATGLLLSPGNPDRQSQDPLLPPERFSEGTLRNCQLAVLSACATGRDSDFETGAPENIARSFVKARVPHVVAARWEIDSSISRLFVESFYDFLLQGNGVSKSLQNASKLLRQSVRTAHPYYWAAFGAYGRP